MVLPFVDIARQLVRARLRQAAWGAAGVVALATVLLTAVGLAAAAGIIVTASHIGVVEALLAWSGGLFAAVLIALLAQMMAARRRRRRELARLAAAPVGDPAATLMSDIGFQAGVKAGNALSPLAMVAAAFVVGTLVARSGGRR